jgi:FkbM family methyltransferase
MKNIFIDCGTQLGQGLKNICKLENVTNEWDVYSFEANPITFEKVKKNKHVRYFNVAVSDRYDFLNFNCEKWDDENGFIGGGSTLVNLKYWNTDRVYGNKPEYLKTIVPVIDLTDFILKIKPEEKSIVLKIDIEGAEYNVLKKLKDLDLFKYIKKIYIEFHDHLLDNLDVNNNSNYWFNYCYYNNVTMEPWS